MRAQTPLAADLVYTDMPTQSRTLGWSDYCVEPVTLIDVPGDHMTILSPGPVREVAERLRLALDESEALREIPLTVGGGQESVAS
jgi:thioesterase domain-containing protein